VLVLLHLFRVLLVIWLSVENMMNRNHLTRFYVSAYLLSLAARMICIFTPLV